ncbi:stressosome-associated protein Prli42 [Fredinandcohnia quinoae]|uniref:Stressosome-associated protein Prli42 n=1 Tax=Fredinandcohnia quinoae TaxID=2918902 RepID=A0AAW5E176_9BACI|nr:stressosome-associated protein Prli42 [Fredinandcohnia sp. SECRCQ15]MCH1626656.1 stressosome-associated protein Prli42 [Fredinandcohnia sp. SECRCQ15]
MTRKTQKIIIYLMIAAMALTTILAGASMWFS